VVFQDEMEVEMEVEVEVEGEGEVEVEADLSSTLVFFCGIRRGLQEERDYGVSQHALCCD
jgi:hypothetical protein